MTLKILGICGSPVKGGNTEVFLKECLTAANSTGNVTIELITLADKKIRDCRHCNWCLKKQEEGKPCAQSDDMDDLYSQLLTADALLFASPVYIGRLSGHMACFSDRLRVFVMGNLYSGRLKNKVGGALAVAFGRNYGIETTLLSIVSTFLIMEMIPVGPPHGLGAPLGACGLSSENGAGKIHPDDKLSVLQDKYGIKGARALGKRVAEVATLVKTGEMSLNSCSPSERSI